MLCYIFSDSFLFCLYWRLTALGRSLQVVSEAYLPICIPRYPLKLGKAKWKRSYSRSVRVSRMLASKM